MKKIINIISSFALALFLILPGHTGANGKYNIVLEIINSEKSPISEGDVYRALMLAKASLNISNRYITPDIKIVIHYNDTVALYSYIYRFLAYYCREPIPETINTACPTGRTVHLSGELIEQLVPVFKGSVASVYTGILAHEFIHHMLHDLGIKDTDMHHCLIYGGMEQKIFAELNLNVSAFDDFYATTHEECIKPIGNASHPIAPILPPSTK